MSLKETKTKRRRISAMVLSFETFKHKLINREFGFFFLLKFDILFVIDKFSEMIILKTSRNLSVASTTNYSPVDLVTENVFEKRSKLNAQRIIKCTLYYVRSR